MKSKSFKLGVKKGNKYSNTKELCRLQGSYGGDGGCFYDCLSYLAQNMGNDNKNPDYFRNDFATGTGSQNDAWEGIDPSERFQAQMNGPRVYNENGTLNTDTLNYMSNYFDINGSYWMSESNTRDIWEDLNENSQVLGMYKTSESSAHAVILTGNSGDQYSYYDPSSGCEGTFSANEFIGAITVNGYLQSEEK